MGKVKETELCALTWDFAIIGRGSAAAYFASTMARNEDQKVVAIGLADPWSKEADPMPIGRGESGLDGDPTLQVNHGDYLLHHFNRPPPKFSTENIGRRDWARKNAEILEECTDLVVDREVTKVSKSKSDIGLFDVDLKDGKQAVKARRVIVVTGAGAMRLPAEDCVDVQTVKSYAHFMDMNAFNKISDMSKLTNKTVVVLGPNAVIDIARKMLVPGYDCKLHWLIKEGGTPIILPTQTDLIAKKDEILKYFRGKISIKKTDGKGEKLEVEFDRLVDDLGSKPAAPAITSPSSPAKKSWQVTESKGLAQPRQNVGTGKSDATFFGADAVRRDGKDWKKPKPAQKIEHVVLTAVDYFVYGMGQDGKSLDIIDPALLAELDPILDTGQVFGAPQDSVLGYRSKDGMEVFGALTAQVQRAQSKSKDVVTRLEAEFDVAQKLILATGTIEGKLDLHSMFQPIDTLCANISYEALRSILRTEISKYRALRFSDHRIRCMEELGDIALKYKFASDMYNMANDPKTRDKIKDVLNNPAKTLTDIILDNGQLGTIQAVTAAANHYMPFKETWQGPSTNTKIPEGKPGHKVFDYKDDPRNSNINFATYNANMIQCYIIKNYPYIKIEDANRFVEKVVRERAKTSHGPDVGALELELRLMNARARTERNIKI